MTPEHVVTEIRRSLRAALAEQASLESQLGRTEVAIGDMTVTVVPSGAEARNADLTREIERLSKALLGARRAWFDARRAVLRRRVDDGTTRLRALVLQLAAHKEMTGPPRGAAITITIQITAREAIAAREDLDLEFLNIGGVSDIGDEIPKNPASQGGEAVSA